MTAIVFKIRITRQHLNEFTAQFDKLYDCVVFAKTNRNINHPVHRHNIIVFEGFRRFGLALLRSAKIQKTDFEWHNDATLLTRLFMAHLLAIRHNSTFGEAHSVIEFLCARNENKPQFREGSTPLQRAQVIEAHFTSLFNLCSGTYSNWLTKVSDGAAEREAWNGRKPSAITRFPWDPQ